MIKPLIKILGTAADIFIVGTSLKNIYDRFASTPTDDEDDDDEDDAEDNSNNEAYEDAD